MFPATRFRSIVRCLASLCLLLALASQDVAAQAAQEGPSASAIDAKLAALDTSSEPAEVLEAARAAWLAARAALDDRARLALEAEVSRQLRAEAPETLRNIKDELANWPEWRAPRIRVDAVRSTFEAGLAEARAALTVAERDVAELESTRTTRAAKRLEIPRSLAEARAALDARKLPLEPTGQPLVDEARVASQQLQVLALQARIDAYEAELAAYEERGELLTLRQERAARRRAEAQRTVAVWQDILDGRRVTEAQNARQEAQAALNELNGAVSERVKAVADSNLALAKTWVDLAESLERSSGKLSNAENELSSLAKRRATVNESIRRLGGLTRALALSLRRDRDELKSDVDLRKASADRRQRMIEVQEDLIAWEDERSELVSIDAHIASLVGEDGGDPAEREALRQLLTPRQRLLDEAAADADAWFTRLVDLEDRGERLREQSAAYRAFIDENVLWVPDAEPVDAETLGSALRALLRLTGPQAWAVAGPTVGQSLQSWPWPRVLWLGALLGLVIVGLVTTRQLRILAAHVTTHRTHGLGPMLAGLGLSFAAASVLPSALVVLGQLLGTLDGADSVTVAWAEGLGAAGWALWPFRLLAQVVRKSGVGTVHLRWADTTVVSLRRAVRPLALLLPICVGLAVAGSSLAGNSVEKAAKLAGGDLSRVAVVLALLLGAIFTGIKLRPSGRLLKDVGSRNSKALSVRTAALWWPLVWLAPLSLAVAGGVGFAYAASELGWRLLATGALLMLLLLVHGVVVRWLVLTRRKLRLEEVRRRMAESDAATAASASGEAAPSAGAPRGGEGSAIVDEGPDLTQLDAQARRLLTAVGGTLFVLLALVLWRDVFPALSALDDVPLWGLGDTVAVDADPSGSPSGTELLTNPGQVDAAQPDGASQPSGSLAALPSSVSLGDLLAALLALALTWIAGSNLPALIEVVLRGRRGLEPGFAYAVMTLTRYIVTIIGVVIMSGYLGISWGKVQWLVAAMTVGLGFGLQEIFANFVSGLILLFERPIRVGDIVTVGTIEGVVTRIRMRATVVRDWEWRELLVPNRDFITGQLINWTLTDPRTRVSFPVGVAYGSDTALATRTLLEVAAAHPMVLTDPMPNVLFKDFGESSLDLSLRVWIGTRDQFVQVKSEVNAAIHQRFAEVGIVIPFPQRDLWVKSVPDELGRPGAGPGSGLDDA